ncbi:MAG: gliding motility protein GldC [Flavobacteriales bacterium]|nr:gliding motility protein GldC [Flavobacteriales bacterium]
MADPRTSEIHLTVTTDENKVPTAIRWSASDAGIANAEAKAFALSVWNGREALSIDLWDKDMTVDEMKVFVCQSMMTLADALERSTQDERAAGAIRGFTSELAERIGVGPSQEG